MWWPGRAWWPASADATSIGSPTDGHTDETCADELERLLAFHMRWLHAKGLQPTNVIDRRQDDALEVVITEDTVTGYLLGEADAEGIEILDDVDVVHVVEAHLAYFEAIGAVGPPAVEGDGR